VSPVLRKILTDPGVGFKDTVPVILESLLGCLMAVEDYVKSPAFQGTEDANDDQPIRGQPHVVAKGACVVLSLIVGFTQLT
jgi:hypothetical protein